jgi:hypothetical protein
MTNSRHDLDTDGATGMPGAGRRGRHDKAMSEKGTGAVYTAGVAAAPVPGASGVAAALGGVARVADVAEAVGVITAPPAEPRHAAQPSAEPSHFAGRVPGHPDSDRSSGDSPRTVGLFARLPPASPVEPQHPVGLSALAVWARSAPIRLAGYEDDLLEPHLLPGVD